MMPLLEGSPTGFVSQGDALFSSSDGLTSFSQGWMHDGNGGYIPTPPIEGEGGDDGNIVVEGDSSGETHSDGLPDGDPATC